MKALFIPILGFAALISAQPKPAYEVTPSDRKFLSSVLAAVERKDADWIAAHTSLPIAVTLNGDRRVLKKKEEFAAIVARSLTDDLRTRFRSEGKKELFKNWQGVMVGDGILWFGELRGVDDSPPEYVILAFGDFAFQPEEPSQSLGHGD